MIPVLAHKKFCRKSLTN